MEINKDHQVKVVLYIFDILTSNRGLSDTETLYYYNNFYEERNPMWSCVL